MRRRKVVQIGKKKERSRGKSGSREKNISSEIDPKKYKKKKVIDKKDVGFGQSEHAIFYKLDDIRHLLSEKKSNVKKDQKDKYESLVSSYNRSTKKNMSLAQRTFNELAKKGYRTMNEINSFFAGKNVKVGGLSKKMYETLLQTKVENTGNVKLTDTMANTPLYEYMFIENFDTKTITNDILWLELLRKRAIDLEMKDEDDYVKKIFLNGKIDKVTVVSKPMVVNQEDSILKGYYQDFGEDYALIGCELLSEENRKLLFEGKYGSSYDFICNGDKYSCYGSADSCIIFNTKKIKLVDMEAKYKNLKKFGIVGKFDFTLKKIEFGHVCMRYVDCTLNPESFCPAFQIMPEVFTYGFLIKVAIDYNELFAVMDSYLSDKGEIFSTGDLFYWDTIIPFFDFLFVYILTSPVLSLEANKKIKEQLISMYTTYSDYKKIILLWKHNQLLLQRICYEFYRSFSTKINIDKVKSLDDKITKYIKLKRSLIGDDTYPTIKDFFTNNPFCSMISAQFKDNCDNIPYLIQQAIGDLNENKSDTLIKQFRDIGYLIYSMGFNVDNEDYTCFPFCVSMPAFLGDVSNGIDEMPVIKNLIRLYDSSKAAAEEQERLVNLAETASSDSGTKRMLLVLNYIDTKNKTEKLNLSQEDIQSIADEVLNYAEENVINDLNAKIIRLTMSKQPIESAYFADIGNYTDEIIRKYVTDKSNNNINDQIKILTNQKKINDLSNSIHKIKTNQPESGGMDEEEGEIRKGESNGVVVYKEKDDPPDINTVIKYWQDIIKRTNQDTINENDFRYLADVITYSGLYKNIGVMDLYDYAKKQGLQQFVANFVNKIPMEGLIYILQDYSMPIPSYMNTTVYKSDDYEPLGIVYNETYGKTRMKKGSDPNLKKILLKKKGLESTKAETYPAVTSSGKKVVRNLSTAYRKVEGTTGSKYGGRSYNLRNVGQVGSNA
jgi:hypothetical protein